MQISTLRTGYLKLDGGAMFGVVPKKMWSRMILPDDENMCTWCMRALLVKTSDRIIVVDTGVGTKQDPRFQSHFSPTRQDLFLQDLHANGVKPEDVTDVLLTHLHFDHVGGAITHDEKGQPVPAFPNATYWTSEKQFKAALEPNAREKASFLKENFLPLQDWGMLQFPGNDELIHWLPGIDLMTVFGHTEAMYVPVFQTATKKLIYCADLIPSFHHLGLPYVMAYDIRPLVTLAEKEKILNWACDEDAILLFEHDPAIEASTLIRDDKGRIQAHVHGDLISLL